MPRAPRAQPDKPDTPPAPKPEPATREEKTGQPDPPPQETHRPQQTQRSSAESRIVEGQVPDIELFKPQPIDAKELAELNVYQRWNRCIGEIGIVPKRGWNKHHEYWFTTDADLNAFIGPLFAKYHLVVLPTILLDKVQRFEPAPGAKQWLTRVPMLVRVINADKGPDDSFEIEWIGEGADTVDKGVYKAFTGGLKYFYMKLLQVATGDDPETFTRTDAIGEMAATAAAAPGGAPRQQQGQRPDVRPSSRPQPEKGGRQQGVTEVQLRQVKAMSKALGLGVTGTAAFIDRVLETNSFDAIDGLDNEDDQSRALTEFIKTRSGVDIGKVLYEMGQQQAANVRQRAEEAPPSSDAVVVTDGTPEAEEQVAQARETAPPGYEPEPEELGGGYGG